MSWDYTVDQLLAVGQFHADMKVVDLISSARKYTSVFSHYSFNTLKITVALSMC